ncbi:hypothetical protein [Cohnella sp. REN36]|uniref:hypothetical protein n=1 Tax=Cohnella sp. REN36 TaxID=2887347 RepID=UPI001D1437E0|nr:hypothetical protein [Cohnella sp. REN36]MCC3374423.1 hypothetical protein [Cohnella sp. REN36]
MPHENNQSHDQASKAEVQSTKLNQIPAPGENDTEFSAEEAAEAFQKNPSSSQASNRQS